MIAALFALIFVFQGQARAMNGLDFEQHVDASNKGGNVQEEEFFEICHEDFRFASQHEVAPHVWYPSFLNRLCWFLVSDTTRSHGKDSYSCPGDSPAGRTSITDLPFDLQISYMRALCSKQQNHKRNCNFNSFEIQEAQLFEAKDEKYLLRFIDNICKQVYDDVLSNGYIASNSFLSVYLGRTDHFLKKPESTLARRRLTQSGNLAMHETIRRTRICIIRDCSGKDERNIAPRPTTKRPTYRPTKTPTGTPTKTPTENPSINPTASPTTTPTKSPTVTKTPNHRPTGRPSSSPTPIPSRSPSKRPTTTPTQQPSKHPTGRPSKEPTRNPTRTPSGKPSSERTNPPLGRSPSLAPNTEPTLEPTGAPSFKPSRRPSAAPTVSAAPSRFGMLPIGFSYGICTEGIDAAAFLSGSNPDNTIQQSLIAATTDLVEEVLSGSKRRILRDDKGFSYQEGKNKVRLLIKEEPGYNFRTSDNWGKARDLATLKPDTPVRITRVLDDIFANNENPRNTSCLVVQTIVTVFLEPDETPEEIRNFLMRGIQKRGISLPKDAKYIYDPSL